MKTQIKHENQPFGVENVGFEPTTGVCVDVSIPPALSDELNFPFATSPNLPVRRGLKLSEGRRSVSHFSLTNIRKYCVSK